MIGDIARRAYRLSAHDAVRLIQQKLGVGSKASVASRLVSGPTEAFLRSSEYADLMGRHLPFDGTYDLHEAQNETQNFRFRHRECAARLGVFRWRGMQKHLTSVLEGVSSPSARVIDFGGAGGPLGFHSSIVDRLERDAWGRPVPYRSLEEAGQDNDVVFSSHALEHIPELDAVLGSIQRALRSGGRFLLHVPAFSCERWRAGVHSSGRYNDHVWTFGLGPEPAGVRLDNYVDLLSKVQGFFFTEIAEYCGDDSIFISARR